MDQNRSRIAYPDVLSFSNRDAAMSWPSISDFFAAGPTTLGRSQCDTPGYLGSSRGCLLESFDRVYCSKSWYILDIGTKRVQSSCEAGGRTLFFLVLCTGVQEHQASTKKSDGVIISALEVLLGFTARLFSRHSPTQTKTTEEAGSWMVNLPFPQCTRSACWWRSSRGVC